MEQPGIVDEDIQSSKALGHLGHGALHRSFVAHVQGKHCRRIAEFLADRSVLLRLTTSDRNLCSRSTEAQGNGAPEAAIAPGDESGPAGEGKQIQLHRLAPSAIGTLSEMIPLVTDAATTVRPD